MESTLRILMDGLIDFAGLFPPASLDMPEAVSLFAAYRAGRNASWLGRLVLPVSRLEEFSRATAGLASREPVTALRPGTGPWRLSVLAGNGPPGDLAAIAAFNRKGSSVGGIPALIDTVESKPARPGDIRPLLAALPPGVTAYFEIPVREDREGFLSDMSGTAARAKIRTGGVTPDLIPDPRDLAGFLAACARAKIPFKATAGLHHPLRSLRPLTYAPDSPRAVMHGFLNVFLGAAFASAGMDPFTLASLLEEENPRAFTFRPEAADWRGHRLEAAALASARRDFAIAFGSCSFEEPGRELQEAGLT